MPDNPNTDCIIAGPGAEIMFALLSERSARAWLRGAETAWAAALDRVDEAATFQPDAWALEAYPAAWTHDARLERWRNALFRAIECHKSLVRARERLGAVIERDAAERNEAA